MFGNLSAARMLARAGVRTSSIVAYPLRRRQGDIRLDFRGGASLSAPGGEPLLNLVREVWVQNRYPLPSLANGEFVVDIGAHVGTFAVWAGRRNPGARIVAVEPSPIAASYLRRNVEASNLANVRVVEAAAAADNRGRKLFARGVLAMNTLYVPEGGATGAVVQSLTLDDIFDRFAIDHCAFLKLDCEGAEYEILFSASTGLLERVSFIAMEYHRGLAPYEEGAMADFLRSRGFAVTVEAPEDEEGGYLYAAAARSHAPATAREE